MDDLTLPTGIFRFIFYSKFYFQLDFFANSKGSKSYLRSALRSRNRYRCRIISVALCCCQCGGDNNARKCIYPLVNDTYLMSLAFSNINLINRSIIEYLRFLNAIYKALERKSFELNDCDW